MISIRWIHGGNYANQADEARAIAAAEAALAAAGVTDHVAAEAAFDAAMESCEGAAGNALAIAWQDATDAANIAATENWQYPEGGAVELFAWERSAA
jgi:hypothetical protein